MKYILPFLLVVNIFIFNISSPSALTIGVPGNKPTIQTGIDSASPGDTVLVQPGRYIETIDFKGKNIVVGSMFLATRDSSYISSTIIDANKKGTVVTFKNGETEKAELCGFTVTGGYTTYFQIQQVLSWGGGIYCMNASPYLHHLIVDGNFTYYDGGGIHLEESSSVIEYCVIRNNRSGGSGSGVFIETLDFVTVRYSIINNNTGGSGIACYGLKTDSIKIDHVLFFNNFQSILLGGLSADIINCTIFDFGNGDAIRSFSSSVNIINSIIWTGGKWGIYSYVDPQYPGSVITVSHSNIKNGILSVGKGVQDSLYWLDGNISSDPLFIDISRDNYFLQKGSPCIDSGEAFFSSNNRVIINLLKEQFKGAYPDIGAFESDYSPPNFISENIIDNFILLSCYPNPFNESIYINYFLNKASISNLTIYNINGQIIETLFQGYCPAGFHGIRWNAKNMSSGIYILKLNSGIFTRTNKMILLK